MANNNGNMYQGYWYPSQNNIQGNNNTYGYQNYNNSSDPRYYNSNWNNSNFQGLGTPQTGGNNSNNVYSVYNSSSSVYYPSHNMNLQSVNKGRRRYYKKK